MATGSEKFDFKVLDRLAKVIDKRARAGDPSSSHTAKLLAAGREKCAKKFGEEAVELALAAMTKDTDHITGEAADCLYHLLVLLHSCGVAPHEVMKELNGRFARSGLEEKAARAKPRV